MKENTFQLSHKAFAVGIFGILLSLRRLRYLVEFSSRSLVF